MLYGCLYICKNKYWNSNEKSRNVKIHSWPPKTKKCVNMQLKKLPFVIRYVPNQYKTQQMWYKAILENGGNLGSVPISTKFNRCVIMLVIVTLMH